MAQAVICPICGGKGKLPDDGKSTAVIEPTCHGCGGKGWVEVGKAEPSYPWPVYPPNPIPFYPYTYPMITWSSGTTA